MQTERVTFLTTRDHKTALDAFAHDNGMSVGHVVREATVRYMAQAADAEEAVLEALTQELEAAVPAMHECIDAMVKDVAEARRAVADALHHSSNRG